MATQFFVADRDSAARVDVYADADANPYNGATLLTGKSFKSSTLLGGRVNVPTSSLRAGSYYLAARSSDANGHVRWTYTPTKITIAAPVRPADPTLSNGVLTVTGTDGDDVIALRQPDPTHLVVEQPGFYEKTYAVADVHSIIVMSGDGNDNVYGNLAANVLSLPFYANGGAGVDTLLGGSANDTLSGGPGNDVLYGGAGDDALSGNAGNDFLIGNGGYDRLYGNAGNDTLAGSGNADRIFGGDGDDRLLGQTSNDRLYGEAGNDTLVGAEGSDLLDGGTGVNAGDNDSADYSRSNIDSVLA